MINPLTYGSIPVEIYEASRELRWERLSIADKPDKRILLVYPHTFPDGYFTICTISNHKQRWKHVRMSKHQFATLRNRYRFVQVQDLEMAQSYLKKYCEHFRLPLSTFVLCSLYKERGHFSLREDGVDECPCTEDFTL